MTDFPNGLPAGIQILGSTEIDPNVPENIYFHHIDFKPEMKGSILAGSVVLCKTTEERDRLIAEHRPGVMPSEEIRAQSKVYAQRLGMTFVELPAGISMI